MQKGFLKPVFVSPHAMSQFREVVADLPDAEIIRVINRLLQPAIPYAATIDDHRLCPLYRLEYRGIKFLVMVGPPRPIEDRRWPSVITVLNADTPIKHTVPHDGSPWVWQDRTRGQGSRDRYRMRKKAEREAQNAKENTDSAKSRCSPETIGTTKQ